MISAIIAASLLCGSSAAPASIVDTVIGSADHTKFLAILQATPYKAILDAASGATAEAPLTVFGPTNAAFTAAETALGFDFATTTDAAQQAIVLSTLQYHVMSGKLSSTDLVGAYNTVTLTKEQAVVTAPPAVIRGQSEVSISTPDLDCTNGYIHVVDAVILQPDTIAKIAEANTATLYLALTLPEYKPVLDAVVAASAEAPITVFAPTDAAFADAGIDEAYLKANVEAVTQVLLYHVVSGNVFAGALDGATNPAVAALKTLTTGEKEITVTKTGAKGTVGTVTVADTKTPDTPAKVAAGDVLASNGVVHVIDKVLFFAADPSPSPPGPSPSPPPSSAASAAFSLFTLVGCMVAALAF